MASRRKDRPKQTKRIRNRKRGSDALIAHRAFAPLLGLWGALLGGLVVAVLPPRLIDAATQGTLIATFDVPTQPTIAIGIAVVLGTVLFLISAARSSEARRRRTPSSIIGAVSRRVRPIDPVRDLGTKSLDDPIEDVPFATPAWRDAVAPAPEPQPAPNVAPAAPAETVPVELDLAHFAELPGRNAVWVMEPVAPEAAMAVEAAPAPASFAALASVPESAAPIAELRRPAPPRPQPGTAALTRLRALPPSELSLVEMIERFAGALEEHRASAPVRALTASELAAREGALAEALKALAALSGDVTVPDASRQEPLRAALAQLQPRRGAA